MNIIANRGRVLVGGIGVLETLLIDQSVLLNDTGFYLGAYRFTVSIQDGQGTLVEDLATEIVEGFGVLTIQATKSTILADNTDQAIITCVELTSFNAQRKYNGIIEDESQIGDGSIEFTAYSPGTYRFTIKEIGGWRTGFIEIEATA